MIGGRGYRVGYPPFVVSRTACCKGVAFPPWNCAHLRGRTQSRQSADAGGANSNDRICTPGFMQCPTVGALLSIEPCGGNIAVTVSVSEPQSRVLPFESPVAQVRGRSSDAINTISGWRTGVAGALAGQVMWHCP